MQCPICNISPIDLKYKNLEVKDIDHTTYYNFYALLCSECDAIIHT